MSELSDMMTDLGIDSVGIFGTQQDDGIQDALEVFTQCVIGENHFDDRECALILSQAIRDFVTNKHAESFPAKQVVGSWQMTAANDCGVPSQGDI